ncbi:hypothetical protein [Halovivax cerinus]|uniref:Uncharacterized protein n=1 Tax=Halovivax cerinus TaxID=1487865 RepID=A0ABD5NP60_9EURY|nr:hypothetical protein [Halovivax cerinus]
MASGGERDGFEEWRIGVCYLLGILFSMALSGLLLSEIGFGGYEYVSILVGICVFLALSIVTE